MVFCLCFRLLSKGDVFAVPSAGTGDSDGVLRSLYSLPTGPQPTDDLMHFKVSCLEPACGTSCAIDFNQTDLMLVVRATSAQHCERVGILEWSLFS